MIWYQIILFLLGITVPLLILIFGVLMIVRPPRDVKTIVAYRSTMSLKNRDTWYFAHAVCGKLWCVLGVLLLLLSALAQFLILRTGNETLLTISTIALAVIQTLALIGTLPIVERRLKKAFHSNGRRRRPSEDGS